jgi:hypothetical protein
MMSGLENRENISRCLANGADSYLLKPLVNRRAADRPSTGGRALTRRTQAMQEIKMLWQHVVNKRRQLTTHELCVKLMEARRVLLPSLAPRTDSRRAAQQKLMLEDQVAALEDELKRVRSTMSKKM